MEKHLGTVAYLDRHHLHSPCATHPWTRNARYLDSYSGWGQRLYGENPAFLQELPRWGRAVLPNGYCQFCRPVG